MTPSAICITIPIYKPILNEYEILSVRRCMEVLSNYTIYFVCPKHLDVTFYKHQFKEITHYKFFDAVYFKSLKGYNSLLLNAYYYTAFASFEYMLVYQTDCYVFKDDLLYWANKGYDYVGGIWFDDFNKKKIANASIWYAGNGGFSLRRIKRLETLLLSKKKLKNKEALMQEMQALGKTKGFKALKHHILFFLKAFGYKNSVWFYARHYDNNEDVFFANLARTHGLLNVPKVEKALLFSWDMRPDVLYNKLKTLPFGCHAWFRDDAPYTNNKTFWLETIKNMK